MPYGVKDSDVFCIHTLDFRIDVRQGINVGSGKFGKKSKFRALYKYLHLHKSGFPLFNEAVGLGKNPKLINVGPMSIPESRVVVLVLILISDLD